jgi:serine/threonine protein kinase
MAIVMEYCPFGTLRSFLSKNSHISNETFAKIIYKILNVISYMHRNGVCHRDLKPENIMYSAKTGELKIIDFELAKMRKYVNKKL